MSSLTTTHPDAPALTLRKGGETVQAELLDRGTSGVEYRLFVNGRFLMARRFDTRWEAAAHLATVRRQHRDEGWLAPAARQRRIA